MSEELVETPAVGLLKGSSASDQLVNAGFIWLLGNAKRQPAFQ